MRRLARAAAGAAALLGLLAGAAAYADVLPFELDDEIVIAGAHSYPQELPAHGSAPIRLSTTVRVRDRSGAQPPALRKMIFSFDKNGTIDARGLPVCTMEKLAETTTAQARARCAGALVGKGTGKARIALPGKAPTEVTYALSLFNGPPSHGLPTLIGHFRETLPVARTVLIPIAIERVNQGRYGYQVEVEVPPIAEGYGAPTLADATLSKTFIRAGRKVGFVNARCRGGRLQLRGQLLFANGDRLPATLTSPCHTPG